MKIGLVLRELHRSENDLAHEMLQASEHKKVDQPAARGRRRGRSHLPRGTTAVAGRPCGPRDRSPTPHPPSPPTYAKITDPAQPNGAPSGTSRWTGFPRGGWSVGLHIGGSRAI